MAENKTKENDASVEDFLNSIEQDAQRQEAFQLLALFKESVNDPARMWGDSLVGFGRYSYQYASGRSGEWFLTGFSPRKRNFSVYIMSGLGQYTDLLAKLGKHKTGKGCIYFNKIADIDTSVLQELIRSSANQLKLKHNS